MQPGLATVRTTRHTANVTYTFTHKNIHDVHVMSMHAAIQLFQLRRACCPSRQRAWGSRQQGRVPTWMKPVHWRQQLVRLHSARGRRGFGWRKSWYEQQHVVVCGREFESNRCHHTRAQVGLLPLQSNNTTTCMLFSQLVKYTTILSHLYK